jgi:hypothetical protein
MIDNICLESDDKYGEKIKIISQLLQINWEKCITISEALSLKVIGLLNGQIWDVTGFKCY